MQRTQALGPGARGHRVVVQLGGLKGAGAAGGDATRPVPPAVQQMGVEEPRLRELPLLVPDDDPGSTTCEVAIAAVCDTVLRQGTQEAA
jgi:hypothetical protein